MTNNGATFVQLGQHLIPTDGIRNIDLFCPRETAGGGTMVRVHLHTTPGAVYHSPNHLDFTGNDAQEIRRWVTNAVKVGTINVILEGAETDKAATAGKR